MLALASAADDDRLYALLAVPAALLAAAIWLTLAAWRRPYPPKPRPGR